MAYLNFSWAKHLPSILQAEKSECGLACLAMILSYYGRHTDVHVLRNRYRVSQHGLSLTKLIKMADQSGLSARALRLELDELKCLSLPAILHWDLNHFVVLKSVRGRRVVIHDPATGIRHYRLDTLNKHFTGVALELRPAKHFVRKDERKKLNLLTLWSKAKGLNQGILQICLLSLLLQVFTLSLPFYSQLFIDDVMLNHDADLLQIMALGFFCITLVKVITELLRSHVILYLSNNLGFQFAINIYRHLLSLPLEYFNRRHMGDLVSRFSSLQEIKSFMTTGVVEVVVDGMMVSATLILMFAYSVELTMVALVAVILYALVRLLAHHLIRAKNEDLITASANENSHFMENIRAIQGIKVFAREAVRNGLWQNCYAQVINAGIKLEKIQIYLRSAHAFLGGSENILLILIGGYAVFQGSITLGMLVAYLSYKDQFFGRVFALLDKLFEYRLLEVHLNRVADIALEEVEGDMSGGGTVPGQHRTGSVLALENICFRYNEEEPYLFSDLNLQLKEQECIAIVGPSGCGKSTLLKIVLSLVRANAGNILFKGVALHNLGLNHYRENIAGVLQDDTLLSGTVLENIAFFDPQVDRQRVEYAAELAALDQEIRKLPMQYETLIGGTGLALSGGQVQRILLARALYRLPQILILDEATSHLDLATEARVNQAIKQLKISTIMVAHRPQTIAMADTVYLLGRQGIEKIPERENVEQTPAGFPLLPGFNF